MREVDVVPGQVWLELLNQGAGSIALRVVASVEENPTDETKVVVYQAIRYYDNKIITANTYHRASVDLFVEDQVLLHDPRWTAPLQVMKPSAEPAQPEKSEAEELLALLDERVNCVKMSVAVGDTMALSFEQVRLGNIGKKPSDFLRALRTLRVGG